MDILNTIIADETVPTSTSPFEWRNWVGNQSFTPKHMTQPRNEDALIEQVRSSAITKSNVRASGAGHSFTPIVQTSGTLLNLDALQGVISIDVHRHKVTAWAQTKISDFGDVLWEHGFALANQGDIDSQAIAGAVATGTHGSGKDFGSISSTLRGTRLIDGQGEIHALSLENNADIFPAFQTAIGMLGVMTQVTLKVVPAYHLHEQIRIMRFDEVMERWAELTSNYRHFSLFWMPTDASAALYGFENAGADYCMVKLYNEVDSEFVPATADRVGRSYHIYPHMFEPNFHEMEYFMPVGHSIDLLCAQRELMLKNLPDSHFPLEVRFVSSDESWISPNYKRDNIVLSVSGAPGTNYWPYLRATDALFSEFDARPHWGKLHFMTPERMEKSFPRYEDFKTLRRQFDPNGIFLNPHLRELFA